MVSNLKEEKMKRWICVSLMLLTLCSVVLNSCDTNKVSKVTDASSSTVTSTSIQLSPQTSTYPGNGLTEWKSKMLASNIVFGSSIAATIDGKNYLICSVNFGNNPDGSGTNADAGIIILDITNPDKSQ